MSADPLLTTILATAALIGLAWYCCGPVEGDPPVARFRLRADYDPTTTTVEEPTP